MALCWSAVAGRAGSPAPDATNGAQWGGSPARNNAPFGKGFPVTWEIGRFDQKTNRWLGSPDRQIRWVARLGSETYSSPVVADGKVFCGTNNGAGYRPRYPANVDLGCLLCFDAADGRFLWQHSCEKLTAGRAVDWPKQGLCCAPLVEGKRLWTVTSRGEVVCLDTEGAGGGRNAGPLTGKPSTTPADSRVVWSFDMMRRLGVVQRYMCSCSVTAAGDLLLVDTSNGVDLDDKLPAAEAPSFIALDKHSGALLWADHSPGQNILEGQWSSPAFAVLDGVGQAIFAGGDGWIYSFLAEKTSDGKARLLWKFDCNPKDASWEGGGNGRRNYIIATPVIYDGRVYIGTGQDPEYGEGPGDLWCIDPRGRGDVSAELVVDRDGKPVPPRRRRAVDPAAGEQIRPNPHAATVWHYQGPRSEPGGQADFKKTMHRTLGMVAIQDGLLVSGDFAGLIHCLDAKTGRVHWTYDAMAAIWGSPLIVDGKIYLGDEDGDVLVFELGPKCKLLAKNNMAGAVYGTPAVAAGVLYIATRTNLFAIAGKGK
jgi:outer membrane protein assembly factor BamB